MEISHYFGAGPTALGAVSALTLSLLLRVRAVAVLFAATLAGLILYALLLAPQGPEAAFDEAARRFGAAAANGFIAGFALAKTVASILEGLVRETTPRDPPRRGRR